jgi:hypothetical protein
LSRIDDYLVDNIYLHILSLTMDRVQAKKPAGAGHGGEERGKVVGQRERLRTRSFGPLEKAQAFGMTPWTESDFVPQKKKVTELHGRFPKWETENAEAEGMKSSTPFLMGMH